MTALDPLRTSKVALLTTYRRDGSPVGTPVGVTLRGEHAHFTTRSKTWKVKRIARNNRVTLAPCSRTGQVRGSTVAGTAQRLSAAESRSLHGNARYRIWVLVYRVVYRDSPVSYEFTPDGQPQ
jgi:PPOX class probable F420-dependent enzyme